MRRVCVILLISFMLSSCEQGFLNEKPVKSHVVPSELQDFQAILDNDLDMNGAGNIARGPVPGLGEAGAGDYFLTDDVYKNNLIPQTQNYYLWEKDIYDNFQPFEWQYPYVCIFNANIVLDGISSLSENHSNPFEYERIKGEALFHRAHAFYQLAQVYSPPFRENDIGENLGLPLRLTASVNEKLNRSSVNKTYKQIIDDIETAVRLLPRLPAIKTRPSQQAAYGLMARVYLSMRQYDKAGLYADSCLAIGSTLLNYNTVNKDAQYPFAGGAHNHSEVIFACNMILRPTNMPFRSSFALVDTTLYNSFKSGDLRKSVFFTRNGTGFSFKGSYEGNSYLFAGIALDEIYLIRAESQARMGNIEGALNDLNKLVSERWSNNVVFEPFQASSSDELLDLILSERRKELVFRGLRWTDLRRLNIEGYNITLRRIIDGKEYILVPNDKRYVYAIPPEVMAFNQDWIQNER